MEQDSAKTITFVDLFCGIGSFHHSLSSLGWKCVFACDIDEDCQKTYEANYGMKPAGDITQIDPADVPKFDVLCAGFPCQPFSDMGNRKGFEDARGNMFFELMRFVNHHQPSAVILENVLGLKRHDEGRTLETIMQTLRDQNYNVVEKDLLCSDYGIPQMRRRIFIVALKSKIPEAMLDFPVTGSPTLTDYLNKGRPENVHLKFTRNAVAHTIRCGGRKSPMRDSHNWDGYLAVKPGRKSATPYRLSIKDCLKLQGFDEDTFVFEGPEKSHWHMLGNTIPTNFTKLVGTAVHAALLLASGEPVNTVKRTTCEESHAEPAGVKKFKEQDDQQ